MKTTFTKKDYLLIIGLGISCTIGYGTLFYSFSLLSLEFEKTFSWSSEFIYGIYSLGILLSGIAAPFIGHRLDRLGVYRPMAVGSFVVAMSFYCLSLVETKAQFIAALLLMEIASILVLYESAFVALTHYFGQKARSAITQITLIAGFASTIFWPLISYLLSISDWRVIYIFMALLHLLVCLPLHIFLLKPIQRPTKKIDKRVSDNIDVQKNIKEKSDRQKNRKLEAILSISIGSMAFCIAGLQIHLFGIMSSLQFSEKLAVIVGSLIGPSQVIARFADLLLGKLIQPINLGIISIGSMALGLAALIFSAYFMPLTILLFAIFFGFGQGLTYIVRGTIPLYLFGPNSYGAITGRINGLRMIMTALAPISFSIIIEAFGSIPLLTLLCFIMLISIGLLHYLKTTSGSKATTASSAG